MIRDTYGRTATEAAAELFSTEFCEECGLDAEDHSAVPLLSNWFFRCDNPSDETE